ncbi:MAG: hypothetical protein ACERKD_09840 [Prolixibacteraceae bacterium]
MKDLLIKSKRLKKEAIYFGSAFGIAFLLNVVSIIRFKTNWSELYTQLGYVFMIAVILYTLSIIIRVAIKAVKSLF